ncbi:hypothetical protein W02_34140 [Nitrospira sp. KM1]|uniref:DUF3617 domain-containing protein n=1 Tax=Nitrospira sp. KM1 TaxID=1936990 RepID=UPI0013A7B037|nr:DUF3617 family protein [Nitrospira sp. KM1]BCA56274.1 hypothetical protein W02_34140 [Nitrospira sp. KM1]
MPGANRILLRVWTMIVVFALPMPLMAETVHLKPGQYEITVLTEATPYGSKAAPDTTTRCIQADDLSNPDAVFNYYFMTGFKPKPSNKVSNLSMQNGKVGYDVEGPYSNTRVEGTTSDTAFSAVRKAKPKSGKGDPVTMKIEGKRTGDCAHQ